MLSNNIFNQVINMFNKQILSSSKVCITCHNNKHISNFNYDYDVDVCKFCSTIKVCDYCDNVKSKELFRVGDNSCINCRDKKIHDAEQELKDNITSNEFSPMTIEEKLFKNTIPEVQANSSYKFQKFVYIIHSEICRPDYFKLGYHTGDKEALYKRYHTSLANPKIIRFMPIDDAPVHEKNLHKLLSAYRCENSEWFNISKKDILIIFDDYFDMINNNNHNMFKRRLWHIFKKVFLEKDTKYEDIKRDIKHLIVAYMSLIREPSMFSLLDDLEKR
jgi:hypothetical protein